MTDKSGGREEEKLSNVARVSPVAQASSAPDQAATKLSPPPSYKVAVYEAQVHDQGWEQIGRLCSAPSVPQPVFTITEKVEKAYKRFHI